MADRNKHRANSSTRLTLSSQARPNSALFFFSPLPFSALNCQMQSASLGPGPGPGPGRLALFSTSFQLTRIAVFIYTNCNQQTHTHTHSLTHSLTQLKPAAANSHFFFSCCRRWQRSTILPTKKCVSIIQHISRERRIMLEPHF